MSSVHEVHGPRLFTTAGHAYEHLFNISLCGRRSADQHRQLGLELAVCSDNMTSSARTSETTNDHDDSTVSQFNILSLSLSLSLSFPVKGAGHRPNPFQVAPEASWVGSEVPCEGVSWPGVPPGVIMGRTLEHQMLDRLVGAVAVRADGRVPAPDTLKVSCYQWGMTSAYLCHRHALVPGPIPLPTLSLSLSLFLSLSVFYCDKLPGLEVASIGRCAVPHFLGRLESTTEMHSHDITLFKSPILFHKAYHHFFHETVTK